jgi:hypothetical protein
LSDDANIALLREGQNYFYLKSDFTITDKVDDLKITDVLTKIKIYGNTFTLSDKNSKNILEANSRDSFISLIIAPSYLVDFQILPMFVELQNPLRHMSNSDGEEGDGEGSLSYKINYDGTTKKDESWFETIYYSVVDDYLGARAGLDEIKNVLVVDKKQNKIYSYSAKSYFGGAEGGGALCGKCNENSFRSIGDTLFEFKTTSALDQQTMNLDEGPYYHYLHIVNGQLVPLPNERIFGFTKYIKMDDSYLNGCYVIGNIRTESATIDMLKYMKNEIYASYGYKFKNETWNDTFSGRFNRYDKAINTNVDDSLTAIDKYNIAWINSKLNKKKPNTLAAK